MKEKEISDILKKVSLGELSVDSAIRILKDLPYKDLGFACIDHHRDLRVGYSETIFAKGKSKEQVIGIAKNLVKNSFNVMITKANIDLYKAIEIEFSDSVFYNLAKIIVLNPHSNLKINKNKILVISAGTSDISICEEVVVTAKVMGNHVERLYDVGVSGIHRLFAKYEKIKSSSVIVVVAGMDGALPSVVAGLVNKPVIAVPTSVGYGANFTGLAPLLSMLNSCANGVTVVNIDNGYGAGYSASLINKMLSEG